MVKKMFDRTLPKFIFIGILNTLLGMAIMFSLYNLAGVSYWISSAANYALVSIFSFVMNKRLTFRYEGQTARSGLRFAINIAVCYLLAYGAAKPLAAAVLSGAGRAVQENVAMLVGMCIFTVANYAGQRWFVFRNERGKGGNYGEDNSDRNTGL